MAASSKPVGIMNGYECDIAIVGGGLSGGLIAAALAARRPDLSLQLIEAGEELGGNHRWSWFASDLSPAAADLLQPFPKAEWGDGYDVRFPGHERRLSTPYRSLASRDFAAHLHSVLPEGTIRRNMEVAALDENGVMLEDGTRMTVGAVLDCRGQAPSPHLTGGWQVFLGRHLRTHAPHGVQRPVIMDAAVPQIGGYRFVYVLPLSDRELLVEDTYYADDPVLDRDALETRIDAYCTERGWSGETLVSETGILPVITGGEFSAFQRESRIAGVARAGLRGGFAHPLTSYSLPQAAAIALLVAGHADLPGPRLAALLDDRARAHWAQTRFYRLLGSMLFGAARPEERWRVFERFYRLPESLIERFYAARSTRLDQARVLCGKPPVPIGRALGALLGKGTPMAQESPETTREAA